jgi:hypothetical protein
VLLAVGRGLCRIFRVASKDGGGSVLANGHFACDPGKLADIELVIAKDLEHLFEAADGDFGTHGGVEFLGVRAGVVRAGQAQRLH